MGLGQPDLGLDGGYEPKPGFHRAFGKEGTLAGGHTQAIDEIGIIKQALGAVLCASPCDDQRPMESIAAASKRRVQGIMRSTVHRFMAAIDIMRGGAPLLQGRNIPLKSGPD